MLSLLLLGVCFLSGALGQESSSDSLFTIQTDPPTPTSSFSSFASTTASQSRSGSSSASSAAVTSIAGGGSFPTSCSSDCSVISNALSNCSASGRLDTSCLCTTQVEQGYLQCVECAIALNPNAASLASYQAIINAYITQCANAPDNPTTLPNVTVTLPSTSSSISGSVSGSGSASLTSSLLSGNASVSRSSVVYPTSSVSHPPLSSSATVSPSTSAAASSGAAILRAKLDFGVGVELWSLMFGVGIMALGGRLVI